MDALSVLREYTMRGDMGSVRRIGDEFLFGDDYRFPCNTMTAYRSKQAGFYPLDALVFLVNNKQLKHSDYFQQARAHKVQTVTLTERKPLLDYLEGKVATSDAVDLLAATAASADEQPPAKRQRGDEQQLSQDHPQQPQQQQQQQQQKQQQQPQHQRQQQVHTSDSGIQAVRSMERPLRDRDSILLCPNKSFDSILSALTRRPDDDRRKAAEAAAKEAASKPDVEINKPQRPSSFMDAASKSERRSVAVPSPAKPAGRVTKIEGPPIILVPNALQTLLNTFNAKEFLEEGVYSAPPKTGRKVDVVVIARKIGRDPPVKYEIRDKPSSLAPKDWDRVVAVFVLGKEWQFKDWPFKDHVEIFNKVMGVYLRFEDDSMESVKVVQQWNVKIISLSKHKRHQDRTAVLEFWDKLDNFVRARRLPIVF